VSVKVDVTSPVLEAFLTKAATSEPEILRQFQQEGSRLVMEEMRRVVPVRRGFLRESITAAFSPDGFIVYPTAKYAEFVEKGIGPHTIFPVRAKVLRFETVWGEVIFARHVKHPGFPGRFFVKRTLEAVKYNLRQLLQDIVERVLG